MKYKQFSNKKPTISFFCPAYNDEQNLPILIPKVVRILKSVASEFEVVIIDDASPDNTGKVAEGLAKKYHPFIKVIHHAKNRGYGGALRSGFENANRYDYVFYTDGDNQYDVDELKKMCEYIPVYDAVLGYREKRSLIFTRDLQSRLYNYLIQLLFHIDIKDVGCAMRIIKKELVTQMSFSSTSVFVQVEVILGLKKQQAKIKQLPVTHYSRMYGKASGGKPRVILHAIFDIIRGYIRELVH